MYLGQASLAAPSIAAAGRWQFLHLNLLGPSLPPSVGGKIRSAKRKVLPADTRQRLSGGGPEFLVCNIQMYNDLLERGGGLRSAFGSRIAPK